MRKYEVATPLGPGAGSPRHLLLGHLISQGSLGGLLVALLDTFLWMVPLGALGLAAAIGLVVMPYVFPATRRKRRSI